MIRESKAPVDVSRETSERLDLYAELLQKWTPRINLVAPSTVSNLRTRHFDDSLQLFALVPDSIRHWADLGSGGGFPGLVIAILLAEKQPDAQITLVESDTRKCTFLRTVARDTGVAVTIRQARIEDLDPLNASHLSARALAPLPQLLAHASRHLAPSGTALFPKGRQWQAEHAAARDSWRFTCVPHTSRTDPESVILQIGDIKHV